MISGTVPLLLMVTLPPLSSAFAGSLPNGLQSFAFCYGYIRGSMQSLEG